MRMEDPAIIGYVIDNSTKVECGTWNRLYRRPRQALGVGVKVDAIVP